MNQTLGVLAQNLFKYWFVDTIQVGLPKGWHEGTLGDFFDIGIGSNWGVDAPSDKHSVAVRCLRGIDCHALAQRQIPEALARYLSEKQAADRALHAGVILIEGSGSFCGRSLCWFPQYPRLFDVPLCYSNFCERLNPRCKPPQALIIWLQFRRAYDQGELEGFKTGIPPTSRRKPRRRCFSKRSCCVRIGPEIEPDAQRVVGSLGELHMLRECSPPARPVRSVRLFAVRCAPRRLRRGTG